MPEWTFQFNFPLTQSSPYENIALGPEPEGPIGFEYFLLWKFQGEDAPIPEEIKAVFRRVEQQQKEAENA